MRKTKKTNRTTEVEETVDILCNACGGTCGVTIDYRGTTNYNGLLEVEIRGSYGSEVIGDCTSWRFSICEYCLSKIVKKFSLPHEIDALCTPGFVSAGKEYNKCAKRYNKEIDKMEREWRKLAK